MSRTYKWQTENRDDQATFLDAFVRLFRILSGPQAPLHLDGLRDHEILAGTPHDLCLVQELIIRKSARTVRTHQKCGTNAFSKTRTVASDGESNRPH